MIGRLIFYLLLMLPVVTDAQYKNDNVFFKTVSGSDLCTALEKNKDQLLLDVRSTDEYNERARNI